MYQLSDVVPWGRGTDDNDNLLFVLFFLMYIVDSYNLVVVIHRIKLIIS